MKLFTTKEDAIKDMERRKIMYIDDKDNDFTFMENESSENCIVFADELSEYEDDREGEFHICLVELNVNQNTCFKGKRGNNHGITYRKAYCQIKSM